MSFVPYMHNKANQPQSLRSLDSLAVAFFVNGFAIYTQKNQQQVCRCLRRYKRPAKEPQSLKEWL